MTFSQRYLRVLEHGRLAVEIALPARQKLWAWICANNPTFGVQRDPNDNWISKTSAIEEVADKLRVEHGWEEYPGNSHTDPMSGTDVFKALRWVFMDGGAPLMFDAIELIGREMLSPEKEALPRKVNEIFKLHDCPWRYFDGEFFKLDSDFVGARLAISAHEGLVANKFAGATDEYAKAKRSLSLGETKDAIYLANHSFESVMKVLTGDSNGSADMLIKKLRTDGFFDDLPESARNGFTDQVLKALPFMRNRLGGHGQGADVVTVAQPYAELAVQMAAALHNFLIAKHLERQPRPAPPPAPVEKSPSWDSDDIPF